MKRILPLVMLGAIVAFAAPASAQGTAPATAPKAAAPAATPAAAPAAAPAATPAAAPNAQQQRMKDCNVKAEGKSEDARKAFMSSCLSGKEPEAKKMTQQQ